MKRRLERIEESIARYIVQLETAEQAPNGASHDGSTKPF